MNFFKFCVILSLTLTNTNCASTSEELSYETDDIIIEELSEFSGTSSPPNDELLSSSNSPDDLIANHTRCSQTQLSFTKETLLHIWEIKGLIGYISYIKRFDQAFEVSTDHVSFKSDNVDGKWIFKMHKVRHHSPFSIHTSSSPISTTSSASSAGYSGFSDIGDIRIVATYSYEAKQPKKGDFIIRPTIIHGSKEIALPPQKSTSPTIVQQKFYNTRGYQLNTNFLEYVYTFSWNNLIQPINDIKSSLYNMKYEFQEADGSKAKPSEAHKSSYYVHNGGEEASDELFEEITRTDFSGHFGDITIKFVISAFFPQDPVSVTSSRCNSSVLDIVSESLLEKLATPSKQANSGPGYVHKDGAQHRLTGHGTSPPYLRYSNSMLHDDRFADVILVVGQNELPAHRIILATSSPVFSAILDNTTVGFNPLVQIPPADVNRTDCSDQQPHRLPRILIEPQNIEIDSVVELLRYIYTGAVDNNRVKDVHIVHGLIIIADKYGFPELKRHCEGILLLGMNAENAMEMYELGTQVSSHKISRKALIIMKLNKAKLASQTEVFRDLSMRHPTLMYELFLAD